MQSVLSSARPRALLAVALALTLLIGIADTVTSRAERVDAETDQITALSGEVAALSRTTLDPDVRDQCINYVDKAFAHAEGVVADRSEVNSVQEVMVFGSPVISARDNQTGEDVRGHLCDLLPVYTPGADLGGATELRKAALDQYPPWVVQGRIYQRDRSWIANQDWQSEGLSGSPYPSNWSTFAEGCLDAVKPDDGAQCDEFPNATMFQGGDPSVERHGLLKQPALSWMTAKDNGAEGSAWGNFVAKCRPYAFSNDTSIGTFPGDLAVLVVPIKQDTPAKADMHCGREIVCETEDCAPPQAPECLTFDETLLPDVDNLVDGIGGDLGLTPFVDLDVEESSAETYGVGWDNPILNTSPAESVTMTATWTVGADGEVADAQFGNLGLSASVEASANLTASVAMPKDHYETLAAGSGCFPALFAPAEWPVGTMYQIAGETVLGLTGSASLSQPLPGGRHPLDILRLDLGMSEGLGVDVIMVKADTETVRFYAGPSGSTAKHVGLGSGWGDYGADLGFDWSEQRMLGRFVDVRIEDGLFSKAEQQRIWGQLLDPTAGRTAPQFVDHGKISLTHTTYQQSVGLQLGDFLDWEAEIDPGNSRVLQVIHEGGSTTEPWREFERFAVYEQGLGFLYQESDRGAEVCSKNALIQFEPYNGLARIYRDAFNPSGPEPDPAEPFAVTVRMGPAGLDEVKQVSFSGANQNLHEVIQSRQNVGQLFGSLVESNYAFYALANHLADSQTLRNLDGSPLYDFERVRLTFGDVDHRPVCLHDPIVDGPINIVPIDPDPDPAGVPVTDGQYAHVAMLHRLDPWLRQQVATCNGVAVGAHHVLTTARCATEIDRWGVPRPSVIGDAIAIGRHDLMDRDDQGIETTVTDVTIHPDAVIGGNDPGDTRYESTADLAILTVGATIPAEYIVDFDPDALLVPETAAPHRAIGSAECCVIRGSGLGRGSLRAVDVESQVPRPGILRATQPGGLGSSGLIQGAPLLAGRTDDATLVGVGLGGDDYVDLRTFSGGHMNWIMAVVSGFATAAAEADGGLKLFAIEDGRPAGPHMVRRSWYRCSGTEQVGIYLSLDDRAPADDACKQSESGGWAFHQVGSFYQLERANRCLDHSSSFGPSHWNCVARPGRSSDQRWRVEIDFDHKSPFQPTEWVVQLRHRWWRFPGENRENGSCLTFPTTEPGAKADMADCGQATTFLVRAGEPVCDGPFCTGPRQGEWPEQQPTPDPIEETPSPGSGRPLPGGPVTGPLPGPTGPGLERAIDPALEPMEDSGERGIVARPPVQRIEEPTARS